MKNHSPKVTETIFADATSTAAQLQAEIDEMRLRLAALEARTPARTNQTVGWKRPWRATPKKLALMIVGVMLAGATIVFAQGAVDALFVSKDGNVGIGTTDPGTSKLKIANSSGDFAHFRFDSVGGGEFEFIGWVNGWNINTKTAGKNLYLNRDTSSDVWIGPFGKEMIVKGDTGNVGIGTPPTSNKLSVAGSANISGTLVAANALRADGQSFLFANGSTDGSNNVVLRKDGNKAHLFPWGTGMPTNTLSIGEAGRTNLQVSGNLYAGGGLTSQGRYQLNNNAEAAYVLSPRYHMSLSASAYARSSKRIPQDVINDLCGDADGCEYRLGMTRWDDDNLTETASRMGLFYYSSNGRWRSSEDQTGADGNRSTDHIKNVWDTCYFTDADYSNGSNQDNDKGLSLLVWSGYGNSGRTCELTLID